MTIYDPGNDIDFNQWGYPWRTIDFNVNRGWSSPRGFGSLTLETGQPPYIYCDPAEHLAVWNQLLTHNSDFDIATKIEVDEVESTGVYFFNVYFMTGLHYAPNTTYKEVDWSDCVIANIGYGSGTQKVRMQVRKGNVVIHNTTINISDYDPTQIWLRVKKSGSTYSVYYALTQPLNDSDWTIINSYTDNWMDGQDLEFGFSGNTGYSPSYSDMWFKLWEFGNWSEGIDPGPDVPTDKTGAYPWYFMGGV